MFLSLLQGGERVSEYVNVYYRTAKGQNAARASVRLDESQT